MPIGVTENPRLADRDAFQKPDINSETSELSGVKTLLFGDITRDGKIDISDVLKLLDPDSFNKTSAMSQWAYIWYHDLNKDGIVDIDDLAVLLDKLI